MKEFERMNEMIGLIKKVFNHGRRGLAALTLAFFGLAWSAHAVEATSVSSGSLVNHSSSDHDVPGFTVEIQRNLGQWGGFGLDVGFGFNYFRRNNVFRSSGEVYRRVDTVENGTYTTSVEMDQDLADWAADVVYLCS